MEQNIVEVPSNAVCNQEHPTQVHPVVAYLSTLAPSTQVTAKKDLRAVAALAGYEDVMSAAWEKLDYAHVQAIRSRLAEKYQPASANRMLSTIRGVLKASWRCGWMDTEQYMRASDIKPIRGEHIPAGRAATEEEQQAILDACKRDETSQGKRDAAIIALMLAAGLRRNEVCTIKISAYDRQTGELRVLGKGNKERLIYATNGGKRALDTWIAERSCIEDAPEEAMFFSIDRWGRPGDSLSSPAIQMIFAKRCKEAGVSGLSPHDLRRTFITGLLDADVDIKTVAEMVGHSKITTTARYDKRGERTKIAAANMVHVPF